MAANVSRGQSITLEQAKDIVSKHEGPSFTITGTTHRVLDIDLLNRDVERIRDWLVDEIAKGRFDANIDRAVKWLEGELGYEVQS